ncbi:hypothetical protein [Parasitella parasitica]|uniref:Nudix hydrolase domain-containing protein n=1 Tax=Parasitella parasitica TaxID=35722 RepID=A0A0B7N4E5_9FUNG|nr:hypothetical protein [Parasitella parasitica]
MDKPSQPKPYAGLVIYRIQRNVEFLLLNDSFANKKHWFCPKGQVIGNEDEIKCAIRETHEATGLGPKDLHIEEGFAIELRYLSGTKPKKVKYHLAQLTDNHVKLLPAEGVHMQWLNQTTCSEKVVFKTMQEVFKHAQTFIDTKRKKFSGRSNNNNHQHHNQHQQDRSEVQALSVNGEDGSVDRAAYKSRNQQQSSPQTHHQSQLTQQPSLTSQNQQQNSPLYKTRLCERFETEGSCPYGSKCSFAHGIVELRGRTITDPLQSQLHQQNHQDKNDDRINGDDSNGNQLFKTKLCEKFMKDKFCQYGPKCHFAHGEEELKSRPKREEAAPIADRRPSPPLQPPSHRYQRAVNNENATNHAVNDANHEVVSEADRRTNWRSSTTSGKQKHSETSKKTEFTVENTTQKVSDLLIQKVAVTTKSNELMNPVNINEKKEDRSSTTVSVEELRRPAFVEHQRSNINKKSSGAVATPASHSSNTNGKERKHVLKVENNEKSWMKIVKLSKEEQDEMENESNKSVSSNDIPKLSQKNEAIITGLKKLFSSNPPSSTSTKGKLTDDVKEVTKIEMRNDLSKKQLLYILLVSLLEDESDQTMLSILKSREHLFKTLVKTNADQLLLLKAWESFVTVRKPLMVNKTAIALSHWYDIEMVEEEAFLEWFETLEKDSALEKKSSKFIKWLNESDSEDEE